MAIYLDANILWSWRTFSEIDRLALGIVARQLQQDVFIPWVAAREAEEEYRRSLEQVLVDLDKAHAAVRRRFGPDVELWVEPWPDVEGQLMTWRRRLSELGVTLPLVGDDAQDAFDREIKGVPPAARREPGKPGRGGRDAAVWLSLLRHHAVSGEPGHLLSMDKAFFRDQGGLSEQLRSDIPGGAGTVSVYRDVATFIGLLGTTVAGPAVALDELGALGAQVVKDALRESLEIPIAVWDAL